MTFAALGGDPLAQMALVSYKKNKTGYLINLKLMIHFQLSFMYNLEKKSTHAKLNY